MGSITIDRTDGLSSAAAIKGPCRLATTGNILLTGLQIVDGSMTAVGDRVFVGVQTAGSENGIWIADTGPWRRSKDFNRTRDVVKGTLVYVTDGNSYSDTIWTVVTDNPINIGTTNIAFSLHVPEPSFISIGEAQASFISKRFKRIETQFYAPNYAEPATLVGGASYRRESFGNIVSDGYPARAYFRSLDRYMIDGSVDATNGGYWVLDEAAPFMEQLGGVAGLILDSNDVRDDASAVDNIAAIEALMTYMGIKGVDGHIGEGDFYFSREILMTVNRTIFGAGKDATTLYVELAEDEIAVRMYATGDRGAGIDSLTIISAPYEAKLANNGQYHACVGVGGIYFTSGTLTRIKQFRVTNIRCKRSNNGISSGSALYIIGYCTGGWLDGIDDISSKKRHGSGMTTHWSGGGNSGGYGFASTVSYHPENIRGGSFHFENTDVPFVISSSIDVHVRSLYSKGATQLFLALPGDETNRIANAAQKDNVGRGIKIDKIYFEDMDTSSSADAIDVFSVGTSRFAFFSGADAAIPLQEQLWLDIEIGSIRGRNTTPPAGKKLFDFFTFYGHYRVGSVDVGDSFTQSVVDIDRSIGNIEFGTVIGTQVTAGQSLVEITRASGVKIGNLKGTHTDIANSGSRVLYLFGDQDATATLATTTAVGDTTIVISGVPVGERILKGQRLLVGTQAVRAAAYYPAGATLISIEAPGIGAIVASGAAITIDSFNKKIDIYADTEGGYNGIYSQGTQARITGPGVSGSGFIAARFLTGSDIDIGPTRFARNGLNRIATPAAATREIVVEVGGIVRHHGGTLGNDSAFVEYNVGCPTSDAGTDKRYHANGVRFMGAVTGRTTASSATDYLLTACMDAVGATVTS